MRELRVRVTPEARLTVTFGVWTDPNSVFIKEPFILDFDDHYNWVGLMGVMSRATVVTCATEFLKTQLPTSAKVCRTGVSEDDYPVVGEPTQPLVVWRGKPDRSDGFDMVWPFLPNLYVHPYMSWMEYRVWLRTHQRTVEMCPSAPTTRAQSKSPIKMLQAMCQGVPCVVSHLPPYGPLVEDGVTALIYTDPSEVKEKVDRLLADKELRQRVGKAGRDWVLDTHHIRKTSKDFEEVWGGYAHS
jgi:glycosyltransferase involved in cell wall biosynthesis